MPEASKNKPMSDDEQAVFLEQQSEICSLIAEELISLTPEHWESAVLLLEAEDNDTLSHSIFSEDDHPDVVTPSMELLEQTRALQLLCQQFNSAWLEARIRVWVDEEDDWNFSADYTYPA